MKKTLIVVSTISILLLVFIVGNFLKNNSTYFKLSSDENNQNSPVEEFNLDNIGTDPSFTFSKDQEEPKITVYIAKTNTIEEMMLEEYLAGVIAQEMNPNWPIEALAAQAIASRTLTLHAIKQGYIQKLRGADVSTLKEELQAYEPEKINDNILQAVKMTRGQILVYEGKLINAIYGSCDGQITATAEESFPQINHPTPYLIPVKDKCFEYAPPGIREWILKISAAEIGKKLGIKRRIRSITIMEKGPSGRALYLSVENKKIHGAVFRRLIGYDKLKSTLITNITYQNGYFIFQGQGWGSGVGLCQWGAYTYTQEGLNFKEILNHYYPGTTIEQIWE
ncbi:SpoIID/LytB domain-containing protein [Selenomonadales bacterium OttesenSCG-928-I06]|nr:SpoIID/LytB domain-containing protein [Selenomonadales bacterium OttesenSCG-928-I06]